MRREGRDLLITGTNTIMETPVPTRVTRVDAANITLPSITIKIRVSKGSCAWTTVLTDGHI